MTANLRENIRNEAGMGDNATLQPTYDGWSSAWISLDEILAGNAGSSPTNFVGIGTTTTQFDFLGRFSSAGAIVERANFS